MNCESFPIIVTSLPTYHTVPYFHGWISVSISVIHTYFSFNLNSARLVGVIPFKPSFVPKAIFRNAGFCKIFAEFCQLYFAVGP